ncbi:uncharacterized protein LOC115213490 isoform X3 [Octopus sinensis]|uniref:Uncharacterized protein LOC115213490 isoform X3 n=1 Tax=Octopus sinensis TaxID=2607531 RepID=A0A6P7SK49_9MOLL|nr:uncharacterized protein LOC115213490 isoform X3 [Octopus sinensis]
MELFDKLQTEWKEKFPDDVLPEIIPKDKKICTSVLLDVISKSEEEMQDLEKRIKQLKLLQEFLKAFVERIQETSEQDENKFDNSSSIANEIRKLATETVAISKHIYADDFYRETEPSDAAPDCKYDPDSTKNRPYSVDYHLTRRTMLGTESENKELDASLNQENDVSDKKPVTSPLTHSFSTPLPKKNLIRKPPVKQPVKLPRNRPRVASVSPGIEDENTDSFNSHTSSLTNENKLSSSFKSTKRPKPPSLPPKPKKSLSMKDSGLSVALKSNNSCNSSTPSCSSSSCNSNISSTNQSNACSIEENIDNATGQSSAAINSVNSSTSPVGGDSNTLSKRLTTNNQVNSVGQQQPLSAGLNTKTSLLSSQANTARNCSCQGSSSFTSNGEEIIAAEYRSHSSRASLSGSDPTKDLLKPFVDKDEEKPQFSEKEQEGDDHFEKSETHESQCKQACVADTEQTSLLSEVANEVEVEAESPENNPVVGVAGRESGDLEIEVECDKSEAEIGSNQNDHQNGHEENKIVTETSNINSSNMLGSKKHKEIHIVSYRKLDGDFIETPLHSSATLVKPERRSQVSDDVMTRSTGAIEDSRLWSSDKGFDRKRISSPFDFRFNKFDDKSKSHETNVSLTEKPEEINFLNSRSHGLANGKQIEGSVPKEQEIKNERKSSIDDQSPNIMQQSVDMRKSFAEFTDVDSDSSDIKVGKNSSQQSLISQTVDTDDCTDDENILPEYDFIREYEESADDANLLKMRERAIRGFLAQEETFIKYLEHLEKLMDMFSASVNSKDSILTQQDIASIFSNVPKILNVHRECVLQLTPKVQNWSHSETVGPTLKELLVHFPDFEEYSKNYPNACDTVLRCAQTNNYFKKVAEDAFTVPDKESINLITLLQKPIGQLQQNASFIQELLRFTPKSHPDYDILSGTWRITQHNLNDSSIHADQVENDHYLLKAEHLVELLSNNARKLRCFFLFSDVIVCTKQKFYQKDSFDVKWFIPIHKLEFHSSTDHRAETNYKFTETIDELKKRMSSIETELRNRKLKLSSKVSDRTTEKLTKKLIEHQREIARLSGSLEFKLKDGKKVYTLLMSTNYSREEWKEAIISLKDKSFQDCNYTTSDIQQIVTNCKKLPSIINTVFSQKVEEHLFGGSLSVTLHELTGLDEVCGTYCCLELDSCGQFFTKARSAVKESTNPVWNEEFELELDYSQTLRILCFKRNIDNGDILLGKSALALSKDWLSNFTRKTISMNKISLVISVYHIPPNKMIQRIPSKVKTGVFGVDVQKVALHQGKVIPDIIPICTRELEKRGLDEVGIYRVSGGLTEVKQLKCAFEKNTMKARRIVEDNDCSVHTIAAVLKLYFRELPEPLFTNLLYDKFIGISDIKEPEQKEKELISLIHSLPEVNYNILLHMLDHLKCVHEYSSQNKMTNGNLSVIFGQSLMQPAPTPEPSPATEPGSAQEALAYMNALHQNNILKYLLDLKCSGKNFLKP